MATVIGDYISEPTRFRDMIANAPIHHPHQHHHHPHEASSYRSTSRARQSSTGSVQRAQSRTSSTAGNVATPTDTVAGPDHGGRQAQPEQTEAVRRAAPASSSSQIPSPPTSSSPAVVSGSAATNDGPGASMDTDIRAPDAASGRSGSSTAAPTSSSAPRNLQQQPSPSSDDFRLSERAPPAVPSLEQTVIRVRDLAHVRTLASRDGLGGGGPGLQNDSPLQQMKYDISGMPIGDIIEMVAALLTKITTTNDLQHDAMQRNVAHQQQANQSSEAGSPQISPMSHSVLAFHGKNVPAITILSYLSRIHKYCPTTFEVFLSLLVYFDRMTERVNDMVTKSEEARRQEASRSRARASSHTQPQPDVAMKDEGEETDSDLADDDDDDDDEMASSAPSRADEGRVINAPAEVPAVHGPSTYFVVDSFNIHRLIIAGVTCSSKFFSDVFYTNSRYAKVGGLPLAELNHLELQFLVLNDFRLAVPVEDLEAYATMLVEFYAREVVSQTATGEV